MEIPKPINRMVGLVVNAVTSGVSQTSNKKSKVKYPVIEGIDEICRKAAEESFVLLKNEGDILPISEESTVSLFGRVQYDTFFVGYGSGGDVNAHYTVNFIDGLRANGKIRINEDLAEIYKKWIKQNPVDNGFWGHWPMSYEEMHVNEALAKRAASHSDTAVIFLGRAAGEDRENTLTKGSFYLTDEEENMLRCVKRFFPKTAVILNIGNIIDFSWVEKYDIPCVGICWQGGMETGEALANILSGAVSPSGKLTDTIAKSYESYPSAGNFGHKEKNHYEEDIYVGYRYFETFRKEDVLFPFGHGLSYSAFDLRPVKCTENDAGIEVSLQITNTGGRTAKTAVQLFFGAAGTLLPVPAKQLIAFRKTEDLDPGVSAELNFTVPKSAFAVFDDSGKTGFKNAWVLQQGQYTLYAGFSVRDLTEIGTFTQDTPLCTEQLSEAGAPKAEEHLMRLRPITTENGVYITYEPAPPIEKNLREEILLHLPHCKGTLEDRDFDLFDVKDGRYTPEQFVASLTPEELEAVTRGDYIMNSPLGPTGNAGVFGGVLQSLRDRKVLPVTCTDGPSGIRLAASSALLPSGTALASTWNEALISEAYRMLGLEMADRGSDILLAPGMNIHRDPLCGRNFEYFSEDPLVAGRAAAAVVKGLADAGVSGCPKHFACNNQETNRTKNNSVVSGRALREIYLKGFEICVKTAHPHVIMTSYNQINGVWGHYNYDLVTHILRGEWGFDGVVITDWWMRKSASPEFPELRDQAYRVRAGVDVLMPGGERTGKKIPDGTLLESRGKENGITLGELQAAALHVIGFILKSKRFEDLWRKNAMKVMSFNILCAGNGENEWKKRIPRVTQVIEKEDPDAFGVQEAHNDWMEALKKALPAYDYVGIGRDDGRKKGEFSAVFYKKEKFSKRRAGSFWLSETPDEPGKGWDAACVRICSWAKLKNKETEKEFIFMNTHLDHVGQIAMQKGAELIAEKAAEIAGDLPVILTGDFNITPDSVPCKAVKDGGFKDARDIAKTTDRSNTYHGFTSGTDGISTIDYVFVKGGVKVKTFAVVKDQFDGYFPSDHFPVTAVVEFEDE